MPPEKPRPIRRPVVRKAERDERPMVDLDPESVDPEEIVGTELAKPREGANGHYLTIRGHDYPLPRLGPLLLVIMPDRQNELNEAQRRFEGLKEEGLPDNEATERSGIYDAQIRALKLIQSICASVVPEEVLITLTSEEIWATVAQFRPLDTAGVDSSTSDSGKNSTPET